jgi:tripartite-type tricarboxylate transporter receptor subunit TctC
MLGMAAATYPLVCSGQIKAYAMMTKTRWWAAPDVPKRPACRYSMLRSGMGLWVPKGTPDVVIARLNSAAVRSALADPAVRQRFAEERQIPAVLGVHQKLKSKNGGR